MLHKPFHALSNKFHHSPSSAVGLEELLQAKNLLKTTKCFGKFSLEACKLPVRDTGESKHLKQPHSHSPFSLMDPKIRKHWGECLDLAESKILLRRSEFKKVYRLEKSS